MPDATKSGPMTAEDLRLHGYTSVEELQPQTVGLGSLNCRVFQGTDSGFARSRHTFVYLLANTTEQSLRRQVGALNDRASFIVVPKSLIDRPASNVLQVLPTRVIVFDDMMWDRISGLLSGYLEDVSNQVEKLKQDHYVPPSLYNSSGDEIRDGQDSVDYLVDYCCGKTDDGNNIVAVVANPGVGKTALATMVADRLASESNQATVVPVFLPADEWRTKEPMPRNLADVLRGMQVPFRDDDAAFSRLLQQGYIALVFDGFDELRDTEKTPIERLDELRHIARASNARIIVTVRSSFWEREILERETARGNAVSDVTCYRIKPFDTHDRMRYWRKRLSEEEALAAARLHGRYIAGQKDIGAMELFYLPNCASMIADYIERIGPATADRVGVTPASRENGDRDLVDKFFGEVMERERVRQQLQTSVRVTRSALENIAIAYRDDDWFEGIWLELYDVEDVDLERLRDHAMLDYAEPGHFRFRYPEVPKRFRAGRFLTALLAGELGGRAPRDFLELVSEEAGGRGDLPQEVAKIVDAGEVDSVADAHARAEDFDTKSLMFHILANYVVLNNEAVPRVDRWIILRRLLGGTQKGISGLCVKGMIEGFKLRDFTIRNSRFIDLALYADVENVRFENCSFKGALSVSEKCRFENCTAEDLARLRVGWTHRSADLEDDIRGYLRVAVRRFVHQHGNGFKAVWRDEWATGDVERIETTLGVLGQLRNCGVVRGEPAGTREKINLTAEGKRWTGRFLSQGSLQGGLLEAYQAMLREARIRARH